MKKTTDAILNLQNRSTYLDFLKSEYMLVAQDLMFTIFDSEDETTLESEEEIEELSCKLIDSKEELIKGLKEFISYVELLNCELKNKECVSHE